MNQNTATTLALGQQPLVNKSGVNMGTIRDEWKLAKNFVLASSREFQSLDNLVDAVPLHVTPENPFVGDVTLPGLVRSIPRDSLEQLPVFSALVNGTKNSIAAQTATFLIKKFIFNEDTFGKGLLSTLQIGGEQALTRGYAAFMPTVNMMNDDFGATLKLIHYDDLGLEPGIQDGSELGYDYVVANLTKTRVQKILANAKANPNTTWNVQALQRVLEVEPRSRNYQIWQSAARQSQNPDIEGPTYQFITRHETGANPVSITFCPDIVEDTPLRVLESRSKFGYPRVQLLVIDPAPLTPFGISRVKLASPIQNLMNIYLGNIAAMLLLNSAPPILKRGRFNGPTDLKQRAVWETLDPNAAADLKVMDNGSLKEFISIMTYLSGQIQVIMGKGPSAAALDPQGQPRASTKGQAPTEEDKDSSTNQITKIFENFLRQYALSALDILCSEQEGEETLLVDDETMNAINEIGEKEFVPQVDPNTGQPTVYVPIIGSDHKLVINWEDFYNQIDTWSVEVDVSVSKDQMKDKQRADLQDLLVVLGQNSAELGPSAAQYVSTITQMLIKDIAPDVKIDSAEAAQQPQAPQPGQSQLPGGGQVHETGDLVKMFGMTTDVGIRNAILGAMGLPQNAAALPAELANPVNPVAQTNLQGGAPASQQQAPQKSLTQ